MAWALNELLLSHASILNRKPDRTSSEPCFDDLGPYAGVGKTTRDPQRKAEIIGSLPGEPQVRYPYPKPEGCNIITLVPWI